MSMLTNNQAAVDLLSLSLIKYGALKYLEKIAGIVSRYCGAQIEVKKVGKKYNFRVGSLKDTSYRDELYLLEEWEQFYLPDEMKMTVIGVLENFPCSAESAELVLMVCEDGNVFAYEEDCLHLVASSLKEVFKDGIQFPGSKFYYRGQSFEDMTDEDWDEVNNSEEVMEVHQEHQKMLESIKPFLLKNLQIAKERQKGEPSAGEGSDVRDVLSAF